MSRRLTIILSCLLVLAVAAVTAIWFLVSGRLLDGVDRWADEQRARGWTVAWEERARSGYPLAVTGRFEQPELADPKGWRWQGDALEATVSLTDWRSVLLEGLGEQRFYWPSMPAGSAPATLEALNKQAVVTYGDDGRLKSLSLTAADARVALGTQSSDIQSLQADLRAPEEDARYSVPAQGEGRLRLTGFTLPPAVDAPLGQEITLLEVSGLLMGEIPDSERIDSAALRAWAEGGGILDFKTLSLDWGPLTLRGEGSITLDEQDRPLGSFTFLVKGLPQTLEQLSRRGLIDSGAAFAIQAMALAVSETDPEDGRRRVTLPVTLQDGWLSLGPPLGPMPLVRLQPVRLSP